MKMNDSTSVIICATAKGALSKESWIMVLHNERGWELPGGKLLEGEVPETGAVREFMEETGMVSTLIHSTSTLVEGSFVFLAETGCGDSIQEWCSSDPAIELVKWHKSIPVNLAWPQDELISILKYFEIGFTHGESQ